MDKQPIEPGRARMTAVPAETPYETAVKPTLTNKPTTHTLTEGLNTVMNNTRDFAAYGKANFEAITASGQIWVAGVQNLTKQFVGTATASYDESVAAFKAISAARSIKEAIDLQGAHGKASIARSVDEAKKLTDASIKLTQETLAPLTARAAVAVESFAKAA